MFTLNGKLLLNFFCHKVAAVTAIKDTKALIIPIVGRFDPISKPKTKDAPSNNAVIGRYILHKDIFKFLKNQKKGKGGEIHITDAIKRLINDGNTFIGHKFEGKYLDCGTMSGYIKSSLEISKS